jgi:hypothetical protein
VVGVERNFETLNFSESFIFLLKIRMGELLWNALDENVVGEKLLFVGSEQLLVELKGSALLALDIEVSHEFAGFVKSDWVLNADDSRVEWGGDVLLDLRLGVQKDVGSLLEGDGDSL